MIKIQSLVTSDIFIFNHNNVEFECILLFTTVSSKSKHQDSSSLAHSLNTNPLVSLCFSNNHQTGNLTIITTTITIYFIHPSGKLKLSFDRTMIIYNKELITLLTLIQKGCSPTYFPSF